MACRRAAGPSEPPRAAGGPRLLQGHRAPPERDRARPPRAGRARPRVRQHALLAGSGERAPHHGGHGRGARATGPGGPGRLRGPSRRVPQAPRRRPRAVARRARSLPRGQGRGRPRELAVLRQPVRPSDRRRRRADSRRAALAGVSGLPHRPDEAGAGARAHRGAVRERLARRAGRRPERGADRPAGAVGRRRSRGARLYRALRPRRQAARRGPHATLMLELLWLPFLACLVLTGIHVYLGLHVLARGVIFVDLALAQVAALGITVAFLAGHPIQSEAAYWYALVFTVGGAALFSLTRMRRAVIPQEAVIGIVYAVSAAITVLAVDRAPQGSEHIKQLLVGSILTVTPAEVGALALLYTVIGALHWVIRRPLLQISFDPEAALSQGRWVRWWDFLFYTSFGFVVTSSVRIAGVLLVFSYLIVPAAVGAPLAGSVTGRLLIGWGLGFVVSVLGLVASAAWDLPTGATVVTTFGVV